jgi:hypothetical protein
MLLDWNRPRFLEWESEEQKSRDYLKKDVAMLKETKDGKTTPLTLRRFRERLEDQPAMFDKDDWGSCGCFMDEAT